MQVRDKSLLASRLTLRFLSELKESHSRVTGASHQDLGLSGVGRSAIGCQLQAPVADG